MDNVQVSNKVQRVGPKKRSEFEKISIDFKKNKFLILMIIPVVLWYLVFCYWPMYGVILAFKDYNPLKGIPGSPWIGLKHFYDFFNSYYAWRVIRNTLLLNIYSLIFGFPAPIILALLLNEVKNKHFKKAVQTISYLPHFISLVVICGMISDFTSQSGFINDIIVFFGGERTNLLLRAEMFRPVYIISGIWQGIGWGSIIYIAALAGIDAEQYEAATIDGAGRWSQLMNVTIPGILPTIIILLILSIGHLLSSGFEKVILLYNQNTWETADLIASFVYRKGLVDSNYGFSTAVGLFNSVINLILLVSANTLSRKIGETSLW